MPSLKVSSAPGVVNVSGVDKDLVSTVGEGFVAAAAAREEPIRA